MLQGGIEVTHSEWLSNLIKKGVYHEGDTLKLQLEHKNKRGDSTDIGVFNTLKGEQISINLPEWDSWLEEGHWYNATVIINHQNGKEYVNANYEEIDPQTVDAQQQNIVEFIDNINRATDDDVPYGDRQTRLMCINHLEIEKQKLENELRWINDMIYYLQEDY